MNIDSSLESGIDMFERDVKERYADPEEADKVWSVAETIAKMVHADVQLIGANKHDSSWEAIRDRFVELDLAEDLDFALQARLAWHLCPSFREAAKRCWEMAGLLRRGVAPEVVRRFLDRVTRCYLLDFVPECLVMCRGALENAVNAKYAAAGVSWPTDAKGRQTMWGRLVEAEHRGWIGQGAARPLHTEVWTRGSKAAHDDPNAVGNALGAIKLTMEALAILNPPELPE